MEQVSNLRNAEEEQRELENQKAFLQNQHAMWLNSPHTQRVLVGLERIRQKLIDNAENRTNIEAVTDRELTRKLIQTNQLKEVIKTIKNYENFI